MLKTGIAGYIGRFLKIGWIWELLNNPPSSEFIASDQCLALRNILSLGYFHRAHNESNWEADVTL
jgi:hypothetical protein